MANPLKGKLRPKYGNKFLDDFSAPNEILKEQTIEGITGIISSRLQSEIERLPKEAQETISRMDRLHHMTHAGVLMDILKDQGTPQALLEKIAPKNPNNLNDYELASAIHLGMRGFDLMKMPNFGAYSPLSRLASSVASRAIQRSGNEYLAFHETMRALDTDKIPLGPSQEVSPEDLPAAPIDIPAAVSQLPDQIDNRTWFEIGMTALVRMFREPPVQRPASHLWLKTPSRIEKQNRREKAMMEAFGDLEHMAEAATQASKEISDAYKAQGFSPETARKHAVAQMSTGGFGFDAARNGLTVREAQAIFDMANDIDIRNRGFSGTEMIAAERYRTAFERTNDKDAALESAREGLAAARNYEGPSQEFSLGEPQLSSERISSYIDTFRDEVELSRVRGDSISGVPEGGVVNAGSQNSAAASQQYSPENLMTAEQNQRQLETQQEKRQKGPRTVTLNVARQDYLSGQTQQGAARAANRNIDTTGLNVDLLNIAVPKTRPGQYEVTLGGWSPVGGSPAAVQKTAPKPKSDPDLLAAAQRTDRQLAQQARINKAAAQVRAREDGLLSDTSKASRASAKEDTFDDVDFAVDDAQNVKDAKVDKLGESIKGLGIDLLGDNAVSSAASKPSAIDSENVEANRRAKNVNAENSGGNVNEVSRSTPPTNESLYGPGSAPEGSLGQAGGYDSNGDYRSGTNRNGTSTGGVKTDKYGREIGAYGQFTRDIVGRGDGSESAGNTRVICTELVRQGLMAPRLQRLDIAYTLRHLSPVTVRGYHAWAVPYVRLMKRSHLATRLVEPLARWRAEEIAYRMKSRSRPHYRGRVVRWLGEPVCWALGTMLGWGGDPDRFYPQPDRN